LLGRGGFSEVWEAFDLRLFSKVAVKIHQLNPHWTEAKKSNYTKHATREYEIHKNMKHENIVSLIEVFEIDHDSFATVLELCEGEDLDMRLKRHGKLIEREARSILIQVMRGLLYLNVGDVVGTTSSSSSPSPASASTTTAAAAAAAPHKKIIHYDLKPGNILFDTKGLVKITDFGLSKVFEDGGDAGNSSMELTSQGAGTYWYLPPECFVVGDAPPQISSKVDVWAIGVMFYQMLYGVRPFGEGLSQERILTNNTILNARNVEFPNNDKSLKVSDAAKAFVTRCLTHSQLYRPDIPGICTDSYLMNGKKKGKR
jgi:tousled-like kinase